MSLPILAVGSLNTDLVVTCEALPRPGQTVMSNGFHMFPGGKGANQAVAAARLGAQVKQVGCVGDDGNGRWLRDQLRVSGVDTEGLRTVPGVPTGTALITVSAGGENTIVVVSGANGHCTPAFVEEALSGAAGGILLLQLEIPLPAVTAAARLGRAAGMTVILNPAPASPLPTELLSTCDYLIPNETEAAILAGFPVNDEDSAQAAAAALAGRWGARAVITLGKRGAVYADAERLLRQPAWPVEAVDATAAGDAFVGAFAVALSRDHGLEDSLSYAAAAGALTATRLGAQASLPTAAELAAFMERG